MTSRRRAVVMQPNPGRLAGGRRAGRARPGVLLAAVGLLVVSGVAYRVAVGYLGTVTAEPVRLPLPLDRIPSQIGLWQGREVPIPVNVQKVAGNDDFMSRLYTNERTRQWANIYVAYTARPREMLGHRPRVCYPASGWVHDQTTEATVEAVSGRRIPCLVHRFHWPGPEASDRVVLNFYVVNGQLTDDHRVFSGVGWRTPNLAGQAARYVAQVQVGSATESTVRAAAADLTDVILEFLPDVSGLVPAAAANIDTERTERP
jgi:hypothetical protein